MSNFYQKLCDAIGAASVREQEPMSAHTTFRAGGPARYFVTPEGEKELAAVLAACREAEKAYYILGNGSNLLVGDKGYRGVVIQICKRMNEIRTEENKIYAQAGALLSKIAAQALSNSLTGFEFASGIPGTLGGAVMMNAGAYGGEMKDVLTSVRVMTEEGEIMELPAEELGLGYRTSIIPEKRYIVLGAVISLTEGKKEEIKAQMDDLRQKRVSKQPLEYPSAGSTFKRPEGYFAAKLIEGAGLKGFSVGGAMVSEKHSGFVINYNDATASDVMELCRQVREKVKALSGVELEMEVKRLGEFK